MSEGRDIGILRDLAKQVADIAARDVQDERRDLWGRHNSLQRTRPLIYVRWLACWREVVPAEDLRCSDPFFRGYEDILLQSVYQDRLDDDFIIEPWVTVGAVYSDHTGPARWGPEMRRSERTAHRGSWAFRPTLVEESDLDKMVTPSHVIDEQATERKAARLHEAVGDILTVCVDRVPNFRHWGQDISTDVAQLVGLEQFMLAMVDRPEWLHRLLAFMRDGILRVHEQAEAAGDWGLCNHINQSMPYARELPRPAPNGRPAARSQLWTFMASQETTLVSPAMFDEFMLQYQLPITAPFGLSAYGCCEDLTRKIDVLRKIPNLRRIAVTPWADLASCVEQIGRDYVVSWRPSPAEMICRGFDPDRVRSLIRAGLDACRDCHVDICLKDVETIGGNFDDLVEWTRIVREMVEEYAP
ncbi:MAG: hypothetical protein ACYS5V_00940 [Planctomycetota bacterium]|jgi:hypothetical protein